MKTFTSLLHYIVICTYCKGLVNIEGKGGKMPLLLITVVQIINQLYLNSNSAHTERSKKKKLAGKARVTANYIVVGFKKKLSLQNRYGWARADNIEHPSCSCLKEGIKIESQKKLSKERGSLAPCKPATSEYCV